MNKELRELRRAQVKAHLEKFRAPYFSFLMSLSEEQRNEAIDRQIQWKLARLKLIAKEKHEETAAIN